METRGAGLFSRGVVIWLVVAVVIAAGIIGFHLQRPAEHVTAMMPPVASLAPVSMPTKLPGPARTGAAPSPIHHEKHFPTLQPAPQPAADIGGLISGAAVWSGPAVMTVGQEKIFGISIAPNSVSMQKLQAALNTMVGNAAGSQSPSSTVSLSAHMSALLTGGGFSIVAAGPAEQLISTSEPTSWSWQVTAQQAGNLYLTVTLTAQLQGGAHETTLNEPIQVQVAPETLQQKFGDVIAWLTITKTILGLIAAICGIIFAKPVVNAVQKLFQAKPEPKPPAG